MTQTSALTCVHCVFTAPRCVFTPNPTHSHLLMPTPSTGVCHTHPPLHRCPGGSLYSPEWVLQCQPSRQKPVLPRVGTAEPGHRGKSLYSQEWALQPQTSRWKRVLPGVGTAKSVIETEVCTPQSGHCNLDGSLHSQEWALQRQTSRRKHVTLPEGSS